MSTARNAGFVSVSQLAKIVISGVSLVVLSRLLPPQAFGVYAMIIAVIGVGELFRDFGLSLASIQASSISSAQRSNLFWLNAAVGGLLTVVGIAASPLIAAIYGRPDLVPQICVAALTFLINGLGAQYRVDLTRSGRFRDLAIVDVAGQGVALGGAIVLALAGFGSWALIVQSVIMASVMLGVLVAMTRWLPKRPRHLSNVRSFVGFGTSLLSVQALSYISSNLDKVLVGRFFGAGALGLYSKAFVLYSQPLSQALSPFTNLAVSALSRIRDDRAHYLRQLLRLQRVAAYVGLAAFAVMIGSARPLTSLVLGPAWAGTVPLFRILCIGGLFQILGYVYYWMFLSSGRMRVYLACVLVTQPLAIAFVVVGALHGVSGVAWGATAGLIVEWFVPATWGASRVTGRALALLSNSLPPLVVAAAVAGGSTLGVSWTATAPSVVQLVVAVLAAALAVVVVAACVPPVRRDLAGGIEAARGLMARRRTVGARAR